MEKFIKFKYMSCEVKIKDHLNRYNNEIYRRYNDLLSYKDISELDNKDLAKIFEFFICYQLTSLSNFEECFYMYEDIPLDFKEENKLSKADTGIDCCNLKDTIVQCKLRKKIFHYQT